MKPGLLAQRNSQAQQGRGSSITAARRDHGAIGEVSIRQDAYRGLC
jgi:hypothetical protein